jgi:hypothetical protein
MGGNRQVDGPAPLFFRAAVRHDRRWFVWRHGEAHCAGDPGGVNPSFRAVGGRPPWRALPRRAGLLGVMPRLAPFGRPGSIGPAAR